MNKWYGYLHINGNKQVKRYFSREDIFEADGSPFVKRTTDAFEAENREDAEKKATELLGVKKC